jgi:hypothetical protein
MLEVILRDSNRPPGFPGARLRPLVPVLGGSWRSLAQLDRAAAADRLFAASGVGEICERVLAAGALVIDSGTRAGRLAASALGARDIDSWRRLESAARPSEPADRVVRALRGHGVDVEILEAGGLAASAESLRIPGDPCLRIVVNGKAPEWRAAADLLPVRPQEAVFRCVDLLARTLPEVEEAAAAAVRTIARDAVLEAMGTSL